MATKYQVQFVKANDRNPAFSVGVSPVVPHERVVQDLTEEGRKMSPVWTQEVNTRDFNERTETYGPVALGTSPCART